MASDLTWAELNTALGIPNAIIVSGGSVIVNTALVTGDTIDALTDGGVVEFFIKLLRAAAAAQETQNATALVTQRLNAFPTPSFGTPVLDTTLVPPGYFATVTASVTGRAPLNVDATVGPMV